MLNKELTYVKGIGPLRCQKLNRLGLFKLEDLIYYFPKRYEDRSNIKKIGFLEDEETACVVCKIDSINVKEVNSKMKITEIIVSDETGFMKLSFFNQQYLVKKLRKDMNVVCYGKVSLDLFGTKMKSCDIDILSNESIQIRPIYSLTYALTKTELSNIISGVLSTELFKVEEYIPNEIIDKYGLCGIDFCIKNLHNPTDKKHLKIALYRMIFEEFLILQLGLLMFKNVNKNQFGIEINKHKDLELIQNSLKFKLTNAQQKTLDEILIDMKSEKSMNRLVQGDVGSGKTVVALLSLCNAVLNGYQGAFMAPTEILATQHFESFKETLNDFGIRVELLVGGMTKKKKDIVLEKLENNEIDILIGTHALISENVNFSNLGIVITDEQHRFGVKQRKKLSEKGESPDILVMTATPIPRTLSLILHGDLDISLIDELPPGRKKIETIATESTKRNSVYKTLARDEIKKGRQVYVVCPLVEESESLDVKSVEELTKELKEKYFNDVSIEYLHGKMKAKQKDDIMKRFKNKEIDVLVSTTVIEVGVNVPNASLMIVEDAQRFGLAQLHQLRGRVGRGEYSSYCVLIYKGKNKITKERMDIMVKSNNGFVISEKDFELRGPGEVFGTRQHGLPNLKVANIFIHTKILKMAQEEAQNILDKDPELNNLENEKLKKYILNKFEDLIKELSMN